MSAVMTRLVNVISVLLLLVMGVGCESPTRPSPVQPWPPAAPAPPLGEYSLAGRVQDTAYRFVPDARIEVVEIGVSTTTDALGQYELAGPFIGEIKVRAEKAGYVSVMRRAGPGPAGGRFPLFSSWSSMPRL